MKPFGYLVVVQSAMLLGSLAPKVMSAEPVYTINVQGLHCAGSAAKVANKLKLLPSVGTASVDFAKGVAVIAPKGTERLSPKTLWEVVEKAGYKPTKLVCPTRTFVAKPKS